MVGSTHSSQIGFSISQFSKYFSSWDNQTFTLVFKHSVARVSTLENLRSDTGRIGSKKDEKKEQAFITVKYGIRFHPARGKLLRAEHLESLPSSLYVSAYCQSLVTQENLAVCSKWETVVSTVWFRLETGSRWFGFVGEPVVWLFSFVVWSKTGNRTKPNHGLNDLEWFYPPLAVALLEGSWVWLQRLSRAYPVDCRRGSCGP